MLTVTLVRFLKNKNFSNPGFDAATDQRVHWIDV